MLLRLERRHFTEQSTIGELFVDGLFQCYTLEDKEQFQKIYGQTAVPIGVYKIIINRSNRFSKLAGHDVFLPLLLNVPGFEGVRIHSGNTAKDTEGCILVGTTYLNDFIGNSRIAFDSLFNKLKLAHEISIEIVDKR